MSRNPYRMARPGVGPRFYVGFVWALAIETLVLLALFVAVPAIVFLLAQP